MSSSYRGVDATATGLAQQQDSNGQGQTGQQSAADNQSDASGNEAGAALVADAPAIVTTTTDSRAEREYQRAEADLQAQQDMAFYALLMFAASLATVLITALGVWFVKRTLDATLQAVKDTGRATLAVEKANELAERNARVQLQAYVSITNPSIEFPCGSSIAFKVEVANSGQSPARSVQLEILVGIKEYDGPLPLLPIPYSIGDIPVGGRAFAQYDVPWDKDLILSIRDNRTKFDISVIATFDTVFEAEKSQTERIAYSAVVGGGKSERISPPLRKGTRVSGITR